MSRLEAQEFRKKMRNDARLFGLDVGSKTIGVAVANLITGIATPVGTIKRKKFKQDMESLKDLILEYNVDGFVVGYPLETSGQEGRSCQSVRDFMGEVENHIECPPYTYHDERYSTDSVDNILDGYVDKRKAKNKGLTDQLAAQVILQSFLDIG